MAQSKNWIRNASFGLATSLGTVGLATVGFGSPSYVGYAVSGGIVGALVNSAADRDMPVGDAVVGGAIIGLAARALAEIVSKLLIDPTKVNDVDDAVTMMRGYLLGASMAGITVGMLTPSVSDSISDIWED